MTDAIRKRLESYRDELEDCDDILMLQEIYVRDVDQLFKELDEARGKVEGMSDEVKMSVEPRGMTPEECILLIQDALKIKDATISRLTEEVERLEKDLADQMKFYQVSVGERGELKDELAAAIV